RSPSRARRSRSSRARPPPSRRAAVRGAAPRPRAPTASESRERRTMLQAPIGVLQETIEMPCPRTIACYSFSFASDAVRLPSEHVLDRKLAAHRCSGPRSPMYTTEPYAPNRIVRTIAIVLAALAISACQRDPVAPAESANASISDDVRLAAAQITPDYLRDRIAEFSADEFEGRGPATPGDEKARRYLVEQLEQIGFEPAGPQGEWEQFFDVIGIAAKMPKQWTFRRDGKSLAFDWWDEYIAASGVQTERGPIEDAEVVFVGYGIEAHEYDWNDFKGQDLKGKVLLMLNNDPDWDPELFAGETRLYYGRWTYKYESAARQGAAGAII